MKVKKEKSEAVKLMLSASLEEYIMYIKSLTLKAA